MDRQYLVRSARSAAFALLAGLSASSFAAGRVEYHCNGDGASWTSSRPCPGTNRNEMRALGSGQQTPSSYDTSSSPSLGKAPDYLSYMSVECAQLNDAIRTGPARGLKSGPMSDLRTDYRIAP